ncbi:hypothetical protein X758_14875 [Mesorhizobium sp. LSHC416B00]|nr:hypothetical protein X761_16545 [Mesorhizobium sp. LSHC424B00]ESX72379.1 hypothetical protein X758_14875 [Mesorhizobium sp. LSHC416B00]
MKNQLFLSFYVQHPCHAERDFDLGRRDLGAGKAGPDIAPAQDHLACQAANGLMKKPAFALRIGHHQPVYDVVVIVTIDNLQIRP